MTEDRMRFRSLPLATRLAVMLAYFLAWISFAEFVVDRHGLDAYFPFIGWGTCALMSLSFFRSLACSGGARTSVNRLKLAVLALSAACPAAPAAATDAIPVVEAEAVTADGVRLRYRVAGRGKQVVIAPFALYFGDSLDRLAVGRRIVTYDPRGRGASQAVAPERVSLDLLLTDLDTIRRAVGAERVALIGWSGAGMETFVYALRNPGRVSRLIQLAPVGPRFSPYGEQMMQDRERRTDGEARRLLRERRRMGAFADDGAAECRAENAVTLPPLLHDPADAASIPDVCRHANEHPKALSAYFGALFPTISGYDWVPDLPRAPVRRLVIHAARDNIPLAASEEWVRGQPNARLLVIHRSGHFPFHERRKATLGAIETFLRGGWPDGATALAAR